MPEYATELAARSTARTKSNAAALKWELRKSESPYTNESASLRVDTVALPDGKETAYAYLQRAPAVIVVPVTRDGQIVIVEQYRYPVDDWCTEVPAGGTHDTGDDALEEAR
jgi:ADP-ribose pyrophosphatase